jgi:uncharacterized protein with GYD domain
LSYTPEAWGAQLKSPQIRVEIVRSLMDRLGGSFETVYMAFGEYDIVGIMDLPDNVSAAAMSMVVSAGGAVKAIETTLLMTIEEGLQAMRKAATPRRHTGHPAPDQAAPWRILVQSQDGPLAGSTRNAVVKARSLHLGGSCHDGLCR